MTTTTRDPRRDPRPGDWISKTGKRGPIHRIVVDRRGNDIYYSDKPDASRTRICRITTWQTWADCSSEVIHRAQD